MSDFDLIVIGSGPGGYVAALQATKNGLKTACVEKDATLGGTCLNVGCIPSKALLESSHHFEFAKTKAQDHGVEIKDPKLNFPHMMEKKQEVVASLVSGIETLFSSAGITKITGEASFKDQNTIEVASKTYTAKNFIIATGSEATPLPFMPFDEKKILSSTGALALKKVPKSLTVIGAGVIGVELASVYRRLGTEVKVVEMLGHICTGVDEGTAKELQKILTKQGLEFFLSSKVEKAEGTSITFTQNGETKKIDSELVLVAIGRRPYTKNLNLEKAGIQTNELGQIPVNDSFCTSASNIFAIGDVIDGPMLAHKASDEGVAVANYVSGKTTKVHYLAIPNVIYTHPEVASVGFNEEELDNPKVHKAYFKGNGRARAAQETDGFVKVLSDRESGQILGVHIIGPHASEMIGEGVLALLNHMTVKQLAEASHAHPTLSETIKEACF
jgi:dihydrolipoamide dehydrogenase